MASNPSAAIRSQACSTGKLLNWTEEVESRIFQPSLPASAEAASMVGAAAPTMVAADVRRNVRRLTRLLCCDMACSSCVGRRAAGR